VIGVAVDISLLAVIDETTKRIEGKVFPLAVEALDQARRNDAFFQKYLFPRFYNRGYDPLCDNLILKISFDSTSCGIPISHCCGRCADCSHNPLPVLFEPYMNTKPRNYVITGSDMVSSMLDTIEMLTKLNKARLR
jgi:hypothetical protein